MTTEPDRAMLNVVLDAVTQALRELDVVAHAPVQGEAMHKVISAHVLQDLDAHGYTIVRKESIEDRAEGLL